MRFLVFNSHNMVAYYGVENIQGYTKIYKEE